MSLFRARKFHSELSGGGGLADSSALYASCITIPEPPLHTGQELTKNDRYCVTRLPALPPILGRDRMDYEDDTDFNGYTDNATRCAVVVNNHAIDVWAYTLSDEDPLTYEFPVEQDEGAAALAILTAPASKVASDPGIVLINPTSGHVTFYESVQHAPALGIMHSGHSEARLPISERLGELVVAAENVEPAGIVVATSWKRVLLISLRDANLEVCVSVLELCGPLTKLRFLPRFWSSGNSPKDEIVAMRAVDYSSTGQRIFLQDLAGEFTSILIERTASGSLLLKKEALHRLGWCMENNVDGFIPGAVWDVRFLDMRPLKLSSKSSSPSHSGSNFYVALVSVSSSEIRRMHLVTLEIDATGALVHALHQLPEIEPVLLLPRLYVPQPGTTAFVVVDQRVILTEIGGEKQIAGRGKSQFSPKWEDVVVLRSSVEIIGSGFEDKAGGNPAVTLLTANHGVLRMERFLDSGNEFLSPEHLLQSRMQQAAFYQHQEVLNYDVESEYSEEEVLEACNAIVSEVMSSTSPYLQPVFASTRDSLGARCSVLRSLIEYVKRNFPEMVNLAIPELLLLLEKLETARHLWVLIDSPTAQSEQIKTVLSQIIDKTILGAADSLRTFFTDRVSDILPVLTELVETLMANDTPQRVLVDLAHAVLVEGVLGPEIQFGSELSPRKLWIFDSKLIIDIESIFSDAFCSKHKSSIATELRLKPKDLVEALTLLVSSAISYMQICDDEQLLEYLAWYKKRKVQWIDALLNNGLIPEALEMAEKYQDFYSLAAVLDKQRESHSPEYVEDKIAFYIEKYGYEFASKLFDYYIKKDKIHFLIADPAKFNGLLEQYFVQNEKRSAQISWIFYLQSNQFARAAEVLTNVSSQKLGENINNRELSLSLAKLSAIAGRLENSDGSSLELEHLAITAENSLVPIRIQSKLHANMLQAVLGKPELLNFEFFARNYANENADKLLVESEAQPVFPAFVNLRVILSDQLISLLTLVKPSGAFSSVFTDALHVAASINDDNLFKSQTALVWLRLLTLTDDWDSISVTEGRTDEVNKMRLHDTLAYKTIKQIKAHTEIMNVLDTVLALEENENGGLHDVLRHHIENNGLDKWIRAIKSDV